jgi:hypothetical protein
LPTGQYYGIVNVDAPDAGNSPESVVVLLSVAAAGNGSHDIQFPSGGVILSGQAGSATIAAQQLPFFNLSNTTLNYTTSVSTLNGIPWLSVFPSSGQVPPGSAYISIAGILSVLPPGVQTGAVTVNFDDGTNYILQIAIIATSGS